MAATLVLVACALAFLYLDPYSHGHMGWEYMLVSEDLTSTVPLYPWQIGISWLMAMLLVAGAILLLKIQVLAAVWIYLVEFLVFIGTNWYYVQRDSLSGRTIIGDEGSTFPGVLLLAGVAVRVTILALWSARLIAKG
jgi:hypothetical protein